MLTLRQSVVTIIAVAGLYTTIGTFLNWFIFNAHFAAQVFAVTIVLSLFHSGTETILACALYVCISPLILLYHTLLQ